MRCDGEPVRLGMRITRRMSRASQPDKQNGTLSVHTIRASGHAHRTNRPNTRLHPTTTPNHQINPCIAGAIHTGHSQPVQYLRIRTASDPPIRPCGFRGPAEKKTAAAWPPSYAQVSVEDQAVKSALACLRRRTATIPAKLNSPASIKAQVAGSGTLLTVKLSKAPVNC